MENYYVANCKKNRTGRITSGYDYLFYETFWKGKQEIPFVIVNKDGEYFEFFTKTKFTYNQGSLRLPESTLSFWLGYSRPDCYSVGPTTALKLIEPHMKHSQKCIAQMKLCFEWYRKEYDKREKERMQAEQESEDARIKLLRYWNKH